MSDYDIITHSAPYLSCVYVCCLALPVYIYYTVCSYISTQLFPPLSSHISSDVLTHQNQQQEGHSALKVLSTGNLA